MMKSSQSIRAAALIGAFLSTLVVAPANAQGGRVTADAYHPTTRARDGFAVSTGEIDRHLGLTGALTLDFANDPVVFYADAGQPSSQRNRVVGRQLVAHALFGIGLYDRLQLNVGLPVSLIQRGDSAGSLPSNVAGADGAGLGDLWLSARVRLVGDSTSRFGLAAQVALSTPTARAADDSQHYNGEQSVTFSPTVMAHVNIGIVRIAANLGFRVRNNQRFAGVERGDELTYGVGAIVRLADDDVQLSAEMYGSASVQDFGGWNAPLEALVGAKYFHDSGFYAGGGLGLGLVRGFGSPDFRALISLGYTSPAPDPAPERVPEPATDPIAATDSDGDGILDLEDRCPVDPEDIDTFEDTDGCLDPDDDGDGVLDFNDGARLIPEDRDGYEDTDGVPEIDNDGDGIVDTDDRCPIVAGTIEDAGCPPSDRDADTVIDRRDNCPDEAGSVENHGCLVRQRVIITGDLLEITESVFFRTNRDVIDARSFELLDNVAAVINAHPEIAAVSVEGHTDSRGNRARNIRLSQARAIAVVRYLVAHGVASERLRSVGYGPDRPIVPNARLPEDHARNRRVEFRIVPAEAPAAP